MESTKKTTAKEVNVKEILNTSKNLMNDENLLNLDLQNLDSVNFSLLVSEINKNTKQTKTSIRNKMFKIEVDKQKRKKIRSTRDKYFKNIIFLFDSKNETELKKEIQNFDKFYKETYFLNDYSIESIAFNNSDNETKIITKIALEIIKNNKAK